MPILTSSPPYTIIPAGWRDLRQVMRVEHECFREDAWPTLDILAVLLLPGMLRFKAQIGEAIIGFATAEERDGSGWITSIGVLPAYRRQGVARALLAACEGGLRQGRIRLCVRRDNIPAQRLYEAEGYIQIDIWKEYYRGGEDALVMQKDR